MASPARALIATSSGVIEISVCEAVAHVCEVEVASAAVATDIDSVVGGAQAYDTVCFFDRSSTINSDTIRSCLKLVAKRGRICFLHPAAQVSCRSVAVMNGVTAVENLEVDLLGTSFCLVKGIVPGFDVGSKSSINMNSSKGSRLQPSVWRIDEAVESDLIDEDELLTEEDLKPVMPPAKNGCPPTKKACANCSCGRAEAEAAGVQVKLTQAMIDNPQSACGSCGLGDAFRCATCPYRGLPSFQPGKRIELAADFLAADA